MSEALRDIGACCEVSFDEGTRIIDEAVEAAESIGKRVRVFAGEAP